MAYWLPKSISENSKYLKNILFLQVCIYLLLLKISRASDIVTYYYSIVKDKTFHLSTQMSDTQIYYIHVFNEQCTYKCISLTL